MTVADSGITFNSPALTMTRASTYLSHLFATHTTSFTGLPTAPGLKYIHYGTGKRAPLHVVRYLSALLHICREGSQQGCRAPCSHR